MNWLSSAPPVMRPASTLRPDATARSRCRSDEENHHAVMKRAICALDAAAKESSTARRIGAVHLLMVKACTVMMALSTSPA